MLLEPASRRHPGYLDRVWIGTRIHPDGAATVTMSNPRPVPGGGGDFCAGPDDELSMATGCYRGSIALACKQLSRYGSNVRRKSAVHLSDESMSRWEPSYT